MQAQKSGASTVTINAYDIVNKELKNTIETAIEKGNVFGWQVSKGKDGVEAVFTKKLKE